jgi:hypothetical protein
MVELSPDEARILGVLIEKAFTTPELYPLTLNAIVNGCNQRNNRDPVTAITEDAARAALEDLKGIGLVAQVDQMGARVPKYRHRGPEALHVGPAFQAVLAELLLRGPQTLGEIRTRASRMVPIDSLEATGEIVRTLCERDEPYAGRLPPIAGSRAERYVQLLCPDLHGAAVASGEAAAGSDTITEVTTDDAPMTRSALAQRVTALEAEVRALRVALATLAAAVGEPDPMA